MSKNTPCIHANNTIFSLSLPQGYCPHCACARLAQEKAELVGEKERLVLLELECARLHTRLEDNFGYDGKGNRIDIEPGTIPDGIECRNETIRRLEKKCARMREILAGMLAIHDSVTQGQERDLRDQWIPAARIALTKNEKNDH